MASVDLTPKTERYLAATRDALAWLQDDGYREVDLLPGGTRFHLYYAGAQGRLIVSVDAARRRVEVMLAPPDLGDPLKPIDSLREPRISLEALRAIHGLSPIVRSLGAESDDASIARLREYLHGLDALRDRELTGDWSAFDEARERRSEPRDVVEQIRDPELRALLRRYPPPR